MNRDSIIASMCLTYRHDFGLLHPDEQESIRVTMKQIFDNDIAPHMEFKPKEDFKTAFDVSLKAAAEGLQAPGLSEISVDYGGVKVTLKK